MGVYNTYGNKVQAQLKVADELCLRHFNIGEEVDIPDGLYIDYGGIIVVKDHVLVDEFCPPEVFDKWGGRVDLIRLLEPLNPLTVAINGAIVGEAAGRTKHL